MPWPHVKPSTGSIRGGRVERAKGLALKEAKEMLLEAKESDEHQWTFHYMFILKQTTVGPLHSCFFKLALTSFETHNCVSYSGKCFVWSLSSAFQGQNQISEPRMVFWRRSLAARQPCSQDIPNTNIKLDMMCRIWWISPEGSPAWRNL